MQDDTQARVLSYVTTLLVLRPEWAGALVLSVGLDAEGASLALAANIAGAVSLAVDADSERCRAALRTGACDFAVNTVDEALRVIKNEIRKHQPLSVALESQPGAALAELIERGVLPQLFADFSPEGSWLEAANKAFAPLGTQVVDIRTTAANEVLAHYLAEHGLSTATFTFGSSATLRNFDCAVTALLPEADQRRRWLAAAPRHFHRERPHRRVLLLTETERVALEQDFRGSYAPAISSLSA